MVSVSVPMPMPARGEASPDDKQKARFYLQAARSQARAGNYDGAAAMVAKARELNIKWGLFDETPDKVAAAIEKARPAKAAAPAVATGAKDRNAAKARLKEARAMIASQQFEQAEAVALDVKSWNISYGMFDDTPDKVAAAARVLRRRDSLRSTNPREQPSQGVYDVLVQEARQMMKVGDYKGAAEKAKQAARMNVVPSVTSDRAEDVLHDIKIAWSKADPSLKVASTDVPDPAMAQIEREANDLLAKGDRKGAEAKFKQVEDMQARLIGQDPADAGNAPKADPIPAADSALAPAPAPAPIAAPASPGASMLMEADALYKSGNYAAAKQAAERAKAADAGLAPHVDELIAQIGLAEQGGVLGIYESSLAAIRKGDVAKARGLLTEIASTDGVDDGMRQKAQSLLDKLPKESAPGTAVVNDRLAPTEESDTLAAQKLNAEVGTKIAEARRLQETDPDKAMAMYQQTLQAVKAAGLPDNLSKTMVRRLEVAMELAKKDKVAFDAKMKDKTYRTEIEQKRLRIFEADVAKKDRLKVFMDKATTALAEERYDEAEVWAKKAQEVDPSEVAAIIVSYKAKMERRYKTDRSNRAESENAAVTVFQEVDHAAIMNPEVQVRGIMFPKEFKDLTKERLRMNDRLAIKKPLSVLAIEAKLKQPVTVNFDKQPLGDAISFLQNYTGLNIALDPKALSDENVTTASPVDLKGSMKLETVLKLVLKPLGLTYKVEDDVLLITSPQTSMANTISRPYYVGDLVMSPVSDPTNPNPGQSPPPNPTDPIPQAQLGNGVSTLVPGGYNGVVTSRGERPKINMDPLISVITSSVAPGTWRVQDAAGNDVSSAYGMGGGFAGGGADAADVATIGSVTPFYLSISLIIRHTAEVHDQVADLLKQLRRLQDLQVSIEVRFITVSDSFFEQIGVDFDFSIQSDAIGKHSSLAVVNPAGSLFTTAGTPGATGGTTGGAGGGGSAGGGGPAAVSAAVPVASAAVEASVAAAATSAAPAVVPVAAAATSAAAAVLPAAAPAAVQAVVPAAVVAAQPQPRAAPMSSTRSATSPSGREAPWSARRAVVSATSRRTSRFRSPREVPVWPCPATPCRMREPRSESRS